MSHFRTFLSQNTFSKHVKTPYILFDLVNIIFQKKHLILSRNNIYISSIRRLMSHCSDIIVLIFHILKACNNTIYCPIQSILYFQKNVFYCFMTTPYIVRFQQLLYCPISDNIVPKFTPHSCNNATFTCLISDSIVFML